MLGGVTSTRLVRDRRPGYGIYFTSKRIVGVRRRFPALTINLMLLGLLVSFAFFFTILNRPISPYDLLVSILIPLSGPVFGALSSSVADRMLARGDSDLKRQLRRKREFDIPREQILDLSIQHPFKKFYGMRNGVFNIRLKQYGTSTFSVNVNGWNQYVKLRELVIAFSKFQPPVSLTDS